MWHDGSCFHGGEAFRSHPKMILNSEFGTWSYKGYHKGTSYDICYYILCFIGETFLPLGTSLDSLNPVVTEMWHSAQSQNTLVFGLHELGGCPAHRHMISSMCFYFHLAIGDWMKLVRFMPILYQLQYGTSGTGLEVYIYKARIMKNDLTDQGDSYDSPVEDG